MKAALLLVATACLLQAVNPADVTSGLTCYSCFYDPWATIDKGDSICITEDLRDSKLTKQSKLYNYCVAKLGYENGILMSASRYGSVTVPQLPSNDESRAKRDTYEYEIVVQACEGDLCNGSSYLKGGLALLMTSIFLALSY